MDTEIMKNEDRTNKFLFTFLDAQKAFVNDRHPDFRNTRSLKNTVAKITFKGFRWA